MCSTAVDTQKRYYREGDNGSKDGDEVVVEVVPVLVHGHGERDDARVEEAREDVSCAWEGEVAGETRAEEVRGVCFVESEAGVEGFVGG